jgi:hypothetical protein
MNIHERANRQRKCNRLLRVIDALPETPSAADVARWGDDVWTKLAAVARVNAPSATTRQWIVEELRMREEIDAVDPFAPFEREAS